MLACLGLGANLGRVRLQLARAVAGLAGHPQIRVQAVSSLYRTAPVGGGFQPDYLNAAVVLETDLLPAELLAVAKTLESTAGRGAGPKNAARVLDIDVLLYGDEIISLPGLQVPHPGLRYRAFVLLPLAEIAPAMRHPESGRTLASLAGAVDGRGVRRLAGGAGWAKLPER